MSSICTKCNKKFSSESSLNIHMKTIVCDKPIQKKFECGFCDKKLSSKQMINYHYTTCKIKLVKEYKERIDILEAKLQEYEKK